MRMKKTNRTRVASGRLAEILGVSEETVKNLDSKGVLAKLETGDYDLIKSVKGYSNLLARGNRIAEKINKNR